MMAWLLASRRWLLVLLAWKLSIPLALKNAPIGQRQEIITRPGSGSEPTQVGLTTIAGRRWLAEPAAADDICSGAICNSLRWKVPPFYSSDPFKWPALLTTSDIHPPLLHSQRYKVQALLKKENCTESKSDNKMLQCTRRLSNLNWTPPKDLNQL